MAAGRRRLAGDIGRRVDDGFSYASDTNTEWLDAEGLMTLLAGHG